MLEIIKKEINKAIDAEIDFDVSTSEKEACGIYSSNIACKLARSLKKSPMEMANDLVKRLKVKGERIFLKVEAAQPGFVNFWLKPEVLQKEILKTLRNTKKYEYTKNKKLNINLEFVSANPTGPLTMANGRGGFYGDVLANILKNAGNKVTREYYVNDTGNQVRLLGESILAVEGKIPDKEEYYKGEYIKKLK